MVNKWDAVEKDHRTADVLRKEMIQRMMPIDYVPIIFASVHEKQRIFQVMEKAMEVFENKTKKVTTSKLNEAMQPEIEKYPPRGVKREAHKNQIYVAGADAFAYVRFLLQSASVRTGVLSAFPGESPAGPLRFYRCSPYTLLPAEVTH